MNPIELAELLNELPDDMISSEDPSAARRSPKLRYLIPTAAACFAVLIAAVIYPKLRVETPDIREESAFLTESSGVLTTSVCDPAPVTNTEMTVSDTGSYSSTATAAQTAAASGTASVTFIETTVSDTVYHSTVTAAHTSTAQHAAQSSTAASAQTTAAYTDASSSRNETTTATVIVPDDAIGEDCSGTTTMANSWQETFTLPLWKGETELQDLASDSFHVNGSFFLCPEDADSELRDLYGIPQDFDLSQNRCLLILIHTSHADAAVIGLARTGSGLVLSIACLENENPENQAIRYAIPIPEELICEAENCRAVYETLTDKTEYQARLTDSLTFAK